MKLLLTIAAMFICIVTYSQISFDVNAGVNIGNIRSKIYGSKQKGLKPAIGYIIPIHINLPLVKSFYFQTGLEYESVHRKVDRTDYYNEYFPFTQVQKFNSNFHLDYINIPLKIYYKASSDFHVGFGPVIGIGIAGNNKGSNILETTNNGETTTNAINFDSKVKFGSKDSETKRINLGLGLNLAYLFTKKYIVGLYSNLGLSSTSHNENFHSSTITGGLTIGYRFSKKRAGK